MGNATSAAITIPKVNYEDIQFLIKNVNDRFNMVSVMLINTLPTSSQHCLIKNTVPIAEEESIINTLINTNKEVKIVIYGKNSNDATIYTKYEQLRGLGFSSVFVYTGGIFEWLLLQDIYGSELFETIGNEIDILKYKSDSVLGVSGSLFGMGKGGKYLCQ